MASHHRASSKSRLDTNIAEARHPGLLGGSLGMTYESYIFK